MPKASSNRPPQKKQRAPTGVVSRTPISLRLFPAETAAVKAAALKEKRTNAGFARLLVLYALKAYKRGQSIS